MSREELGVRWGHTTLWRGAPAETFREGYIPPADCQKNVFLPCCVCRGDHWSPVNCFGVIYMDIMMPRMNGWDAARTIRAMNRPDAESIPIIAMSANAFSEDIMDSRLAGMDIHLAKPLDEAKMINALKQCIAERSAVKLRNDL